MTRIALLLRVFATSCLLFGGFLSPVPALADPPVAAAQAVRRFIEAYRAQDRTALLDAIAADYDYNGIRKADITDPFGPLAVLSDRYLYRIIQLLEIRPGVATALVDSTFTGRLNLVANGRGEPTVVGTVRSAIEVQRQQDGQWRVSALRPVHLHFTHPGSPSTFVRGVSVNGASSVAASPGAVLGIAGMTEFGLNQTVALGTEFQSIPLHLNRNSQSYEPWSISLKAPPRPGRYFLDTASFFYGQLPDGTIYLAWDEVTVPVVVK